VIGCAEGSILLVEDDLGDALLVRENLESGGGHFGMVEVVTLAAARDHLAVHDPTCIVTDLGLPDAEGMEVVVALHDAAPAVPIVVLTGRDDALSDGREAIRAGAEDYITKSQLSGDMFVRVVRHAIERRRVAGQLRTSQRLLQGAIAASATGMAILRLDGSASLTNPAFEAMLGLHRDELLGRDLSEFLLPAERGQTMVSFARVASGEIDSLREETTYRHSRGHQVHAAVELSLIRDDQGQPVHVFLQAQDITERKAAEITQARLVAIVENSPDAMFLHDTAGVISTWNPGAAAQYGYEAQQSIGRNVAMMVPDEQQDELSRVLGELRKGRVTFPYATRRVTKSGSVIDVSISVAPVTDDDGEVVAGSVVSRDISSTKAAEQALRESEDRYRRMVETASEGVWLLDTNGTATFVNARMATMFGCSVDSLLGRPWHELVHTEDRPEARRCLEDVDGTDAREVRLRRRDGSVFWASLSTARQRDDREEIAGTLAMVTDISERKAAEQDLLERERRFRAVFDHAQEAMLVTDDDQFPIDVNPAACILFGIPRDELLKLRLSDVVDAAVIDRLVARLRDNGAGDDANVSGATTITRPDDGHVRDVQYTTTDNIFPGGHLVVLRDVTDYNRGETDRIALEDRLNQTQRMESVGQFAGGIAHDFNNLLAVILNYAQFAEDGTDLAEVHADVRQLRTAAERARDLTNQLLVFSRRDVARTEVFDVARLVRDTHRLLERVMASNVVLAADVSDDPLWIDADPGQVDQAVMNLVINARDAMPDGGELTVAARRCEIEGIEPSAEITVTDTGVGISEETAARVFEPFYTTKPEGSGTGLGLSMVYGIVEGAGGTITLDSNVGEGTCFTITLPLAASAPGQPDAGRHGRTVPDRSGRRVLLVEDEDGLRQVAGRILREGGYVPITVADATAALAVMARNDVDLLLTDVVMPGMSGVELVRRTNIDRPGLPIVMMSGYSEQIGRVESGAETLRKPFTRETLLDALERAWERRQVFVP
jgi:two-component system, cell cycle sensor histidine kinase and response regulator CckA